MTRESASEFAIKIRIRNTGRGKQKPIWVSSKCLCGSPRSVYVRMSSEIEHAIQCIRGVDHSEYTGTLGNWGLYPPAYCCTHAGVRYKKLHFCWVQVLAKNENGTIRMLTKDMKEGEIPDLLNDFYLPLMWYYGCDHMADSLSRSWSRHMYACDQQSMQVDSKVDLNLYFKTEKFLVERSKERCAYIKSMLWIKLIYMITAAVDPESDEWSRIKCMSKNVGPNNPAWTELERPPFFWVPISAAIEFIQKNQITIPPQLEAWISDYMQTRPTPGGQIVKTVSALMGLLNFAATACNGVYQFANQSPNAVVVLDPRFGETYVPQVDLNY